MRRITRLLFFAFLIAAMALLAEKQPFEYQSTLIEETESHRTFQHHDRSVQCARQNQSLFGLFQDLQQRHDKRLPAVYFRSSGALCQL